MTAPGTLFGITASIEKLAGEICIFYTCVKNHASSTEIKRPVRVGL
ncbi:hypothetical protein RERY_04320 [Rhodococcus erythropolis]|jgi:hypothetical protein|nr:hypothetical protein RERY_04320 [Rhodococcus erythropolis]